MGAGQTRFRQEVAFLSECCGRRTISTVDNLSPVVIWLCVDYNMLFRGFQVKSLEILVCRKVLFPLAQLQVGAEGRWFHTVFPVKGDARLNTRTLTLREIRPTYFSEGCIRKGSHMPGRQLFSAGDDQ